MTVPQPPSGQSQPAGPPQPPASPAYRRPTAGPSADDIRQREQWRDQVAKSLALAQSTADKWRTGLAGFVTLVTAGLLIKGPESAADITTGWRALLTALLGAGLAAAIAGLWVALRAASGNVNTTSLDQVVQTYGSLDAMQVSRARDTVRFLRAAQVLIAASLLLLGAGLLSWWWAPTKAPSPPAYLQVTTDGGTVCGELNSADGQTIVLTVAGQRHLATIPFAAVANVHVVASCG